MATGDRLRKVAFICRLVVGTKDFNVMGLYRVMFQEG